MLHKLDYPSYHTLHNSIWRDIHHVGASWIVDYIGEKVSVTKHKHHWICVYAIQT